MDGMQHVLNRYFVQVGLPRYVWGEGDTSYPPYLLSKNTCWVLLNNSLLLRPESYTDDLELAEGLSDGEFSTVAIENFPI